MTNLYLETGSKSSSEYVFTQAYLKFLGLVDKVSIQTVGGKDNLYKVKNSFIVNTLEGGENIIIFDADSSENNGGFEKRREELLELLSQLDIKADLFLFPNNKSDGCFEDLLICLADDNRYRTFFDCFGDYEKCLGDDYRHPNLKAKVYAYISSMKSLSNSQWNRLGKGQWMFDNKEYWDLNKEALFPLKDFLIDHVK